MSDFIAVEWLTPGPDMGIGAVLIYDQHAGFKCYMGATQVLNGPDYDIARIRQHGAKVPVEIAAGFFRKKMISEWLRRNMWDKSRCEYRYDSTNYMAGTGPQEMGA